MGRCENRRNIPQEKKKVVVFGLPGAFTPTCSTSHVPRYDELFPAFKKAGVDDVVCVTMNDTFVTNAWKRELGTQNVKYLPDGNGDFTRALGLAVDKKHLGFGERSWRYSMLVEDGVIKKMFLEPEKEGDPFENSDADTMLQHLGVPAVKSPPAVLIFTKEDCPFCTKAKKLLKERNVAYDEVPVGQGGLLPQRVVNSISGSRTVPKIFWNGKLIGGSEELENFLKNQ